MIGLELRVGSHGMPVASAGVRPDLGRVMGNSCRACGGRLKRRKRICRICGAWLCSIRCALTHQTTVHASPSSLDASTPLPAAPPNDMPVRLAVQQPGRLVHLASRGPAGPAGVVLGIHPEHGTVRVRFHAGRVEWEALFAPDELALVDTTDVLRPPTETSGPGGGE